MVKIITFHTAEKFTEAKMAKDFQQQSADSTRPRLCSEVCCARRKEATGPARDLANTGHLCASACARVYLCVFV